MTDVFDNGRSDWVSGDGNKIGACVRKREITNGTEQEIGERKTDDNQTKKGDNEPGGRKYRRTNVCRRVVWCREKKIPKRDRTLIPTS